MLSPTCQLIQRNLDLFDNQKWALINPDDPKVFTLTKIFIKGFHQDFGIYQEALESKVPQVFAPYLTHNNFTDELDGLIIFMPKAKALLPFILKNITHIANNLKIVVVGENKGGIKSAQKIMQSQLKCVYKHDSARHCSLFIGELKNAECSGIPFNLSEFEKIESIEIDKTHVKVATYPSVFGHKSLDQGTKILLEQLAELPLPSHYKFAYDFACGSGIIGAYMSKLHPTLNMHYSDINALSILSCEQTLLLNQLTGNIQPSDGMGNLPQKMDLILCNPPFHEGLRNNYEITQEFIKAAHVKLNRKGLLFLVANKFLPYADSLNACFGDYQIIYSNNKYSVYSAQKT